MLPEPETGEPEDYTDPAQRESNSNQPSQTQIVDAHIAALEASARSYEEQSERALLFGTASTGSASAAAAHAHLARMRISGTMTPRSVGGASQARSVGSAAMSLGGAASVGGVGRKKSLGGAGILNSSGPLSNIAAGRQGSIISSTTIGPIAEHEVSHGDGESPADRGAPADAAVTASLSGPTRAERVHPTLSRQGSGMGNESESDQQLSKAASLSSRDASRKKPFAIDVRGSPAKQFASTKTQSTIPKRLQEATGPSEASQAPASAAVVGPSASGVRAAGPAPPPPPVAFHCDFYFFPMDFVSQSGGT